VPAIVSAPLTCTTLASLALPATALSTYCRDTIWESVPDPGVARTAPIVVGDVVPTSQYSVRTTSSS
jgi:hypothetical protein